MMRTFFISVAALAMMTTITFAQQNNCGPIGAIETMLERQFGESMIFQGVTADGEGLVEIWLNFETGTWTALVELPAHEAGCITAHGTGVTHNG